MFGMPVRLENIYIKFEGQSRRSKFTVSGGIVLPKLLVLPEWGLSHL